MTLTSLMRSVLPALFCLSPAVAFEIDTPEDAHDFMAGMGCQALDERTSPLAKCLDESNDVDACFDSLVANNQTTNVQRQSFHAALVDLQPRGSLNRIAVAQVKELIRTVVADSPLPALNGTLDNFTPTLLPSFLQPIGKLEEPQTLGFSITLPELLGLKARVSGFANPVPELNAAFEAALTARNQLEAAPQPSHLDIGDDYYVVVDLSVVNSWFGRDASFHAKGLSRLGRTVLVGRDAEGQDLPEQPFLDVIDVLREADEDNRTERIRDAECAADAYRRLLAEVQQRKYDARLEQFRYFVHNQPQVTFSHRRLHRDDVVGADANSYRIRLSSGVLNNVTWLKLLPDCDSDLGGDDCPRLYHRLLELPTMTYGIGVSAYFEWGDIADVSVSLPPLLTDPIGGLPLPLPGTPVDVDGSEFFVHGGSFKRYGVSIGGTFKRPETPTDTSIRLDGGVDFFDYSNDPVRLDHHVGRVTLTIRKGSFSFPLHLMYRTKSEFEAHVADDVVVGLGSQIDLTQW
ncbi:hypothetical protein [Sinimarinibacterium flocculans]|uniref:hypothetical protein n=1 Tax=Sinimarinibacterium flocculans TaxID=985250 RepID=UPI003514CC4A